MTAETSAALLVSPDAVAVALGRACRLAKARDPSLTIGQIAADAGIAEKRLRKLIDNDPLERRPAHAAELVSLFVVLGAPGANPVLALAGLVAEPEEDAPESVTRAAAEMVCAAGELVTIAADGRVDLDEVDQADAAADRTIALAIKMKAAAQRARRRGR